MDMTMTQLRLVAAICSDPTMTSIFRGCHTDAELKSRWDQYQTTCEKLATNWEEKAGIVTGVSAGTQAAPAGGRSKDAILQDFIDSVRCVANNITIADLSSWLDNESDGSPKLQEIKKEFKRRYEENPEAALVYLKQKQVDVLMGGNWV